MIPPHILVVSESPSTTDALRKLLARKACRSEFISKTEDVPPRVQRNQNPDLVLLELNGHNGDLEALQYLLRFQPDIRVIVVSAPERIGKIVEAIRLGAKDYLATPVGEAELERVMQRYVTALPAVQVPSSHSELVEDLGEGRFFVVAGSFMQEVRAQLAVLATVDVPVLILGESGTGKEIAARFIHKLSSRSRHQFLNVNCAALPGELLESELFGYEQGAFTGALRTKAGKFELCQAGTILLDEIAEMPAHLQAKLLHVLQDRQFFRLGGEKTIEVDVRILAATNVNVEEAIAERKFREDLYYRLGAFAVVLPALRERREEIPTLLRHFMMRMAAQYSRPPLAFSKSLIDACQNYSWPGNLRELENFVKRYLVMGQEEIALAELRHPSSKKQIIFLGSLPVEKNKAKLQTSPEVNDPLARNLKSLVRNLTEETEIQAITQALEQTRWNRKRAARLLNISYRGLLYKIQQYGIRRESKAELPS